MSLFDPNLKLQWAKKHLEALATEIAIFRQSNAYEVSTQEDLQNGWYIIQIRLLHDDRVFTAALIAGDFIHCLRCSLDHLAWQLALLSGHIPSREISFPICERDSVDTQVRIAKCTYGFPDAAIAIVKAFQPYKSGDAYRSTHLWKLNDLWNIDKHRHIAPHGVFSDWVFKVDLPKPTQFETEELNDGSLIKIPIALKEKVSLNPSPGIDIRFGTRAEGTDLGLSDLIEIYDFVALTVIPAFACFFPQSSK
jgi:hypothetical protein